MLKNIRTGLIAHPDVLVAWIPVDCVSLSELDLSGELQNALRVAEGCCCNRSEGAWCGDAGRRASEDGVVEYVEGLDVEFECEVFVDGEETMDRGVEAPEVLRRDEVAWGVAEGSDGGCFEGAWVEPLVACFGWSGGRGAGGVVRDCP